MGGMAIAGEAQVKIIGLVRGADRKPKFEDWFNIPVQYHSLLTPEDWDYIKAKREEIRNGNYTP